MSHFLHSITLRTRIIAIVVLAILSLVAVNYAVIANMYYHTPEAGLVEKAASFTAVADEAKNHTSRLNNEGTFDTQALLADLKQTLDAGKPEVADQFRGGADVRQCRRSWRQEHRGSRSAEDSGRVASEGGEVIKDTILGMQSIAEVVDASAASVSELGKRGEQIGQIINVINDIADQTNLLALNAAIEATRAGEHGREVQVQGYGPTPARCWPTPRLAEPPNQHHKRTGA